MVKWLGERKRTTDPVMKKGSGSKASGEEWKRFIMELGGCRTWGFFITGLEDYEQPSCDPSDIRLLWITRRR